MSVVLCRSVKFYAAKFFRTPSPLDRVQAIGCACDVSACARSRPLLAALLLDRRRRLPAIVAGERADGGTTDDAGALRLHGDRRRPSARIRRPTGPTSRRSSSAAASPATTGMIGGPWPLLQYSHVADWYDVVRAMLLDCSMPPPDAGVTDDRRGARRDPHLDAVRLPGVIRRRGLQLRGGYFFSFSCSVRRVMPSRRAASETLPPVSARMRWMCSHSARASVGGGGAVARRGRHGGARRPSRRPACRRRPPAC